MSWYRLGTISLTEGSVEVTGLNTAFSSEVRFSDILLVDGALYEIARVESDTKLKLSTPFVGATVDGSAYAIIRNLTNASNYDLMKKIEEFLTDRQRSMDEFVDWINGLPNTGPTNNGVFPLTDRYGVTVYCKSPKQLEAETLALTSLQSSLIEQTETALTSAQSKLTALGNQEAWAAQILGYKDAAANSAIKASQWAENAENAAVETGKYSAKHHALKSAVSSSAAIAARAAAETARDQAQQAAALATGGLVELGGINLSGGLYPTKPAQGAFWKVTVGGTVSGISYGAGDTLVYSKSLDQFYKIDNTESVTSVNGKTGIVSLTAADIGLGAVNNTSDASKPVSTAQQAALDGKVDKVAGQSLMTAAERTKLDSIAAGAQVNVATNLGQGTRTSTGIPLTSSTGTGTTLPVATTVLAGLQSAADKAKLDGIAAGATANSSDAQLRDRSTHTGEQAISTVTGLQQALSGKQSTLVSGTNIRTINGVSLLDAGNLELATAAQVGDIAAALDAINGVSV